MKRFLFSEKAKYVIQSIYDLSVLFPNESLLILNQEDISDFLTLSDVDASLHTLESRGAVVVVGFDKWKIKNNKDEEIDVGKYHIRLTDKFLPVYKELATELNLDENEVRIYFEDDVISIFSWTLATPTAGSENNEVFSLLYKNPHKKFDKKMIESELSVKLTKPFSKIVENLNFKYILRDLFFSVSKDHIMFKNPIKTSLVNLVKIDRYNYRQSQP